ncbi:hypothetical protein ACDX78_17920 [Virgibacillus oceani]
MVRFLITIIVCTVLLLPFQSLIAQKIPDTVEIDSFETDVTGDGQDEEIILKGVPFSSDSSYYQDVWADVTNELGESWTITYEGGYEPSLQLVDLNGDGIKDIFYQSATGGSGGLYHYQLSTLRNSELNEIPLPVQEYLEGAFDDNFTVIFRLSPSHKPTEIDVSDRTEEYIRLGIYDEDGNLLEQKSLVIDPIAFYEPFLISKSKGYGLKSYQQISGAYHADQLGTVETLWYFENGAWIILQTEWIPT